MAERSPARASSYVHGAEPSEQERLGWMNAILNPRHLAALGPLDGLRVGDRRSVGAPQLTLVTELGHDFRRGLAGHLPLIERLNRGTPRLAP